MDNRGRGFRLAAVLTAVICLLVFAGTACADADPIRVSSLSEPQSVISEQDVNITIKIYNSSQTDMEGEIFLYSPAGGYPVETYNGLKAENSVTYTGTWRVTSEQIEKGRINYYIKYTVDTGNGPTETTRTIPVTIQTEEAAPQLTATYSVTPASAREGQKVTLAYTLSNTGNIELRNIEITNAGVSDRKLTATSLSVGEKVTLEDTVTMGSKELVSKPTVNYQAAGSSKTLSISDMARKTITVMEDGLDVMLKASNPSNLYPGERVSMTLTMKNSGNTAYSALTATLSDGTRLADGIALEPGASFEHAFETTVAQSGTYSVSVEGVDSNGNAVSMASGEVEVTTQDVSKALILNVRAQAQTETIYTEPAVIRFGVAVENVGQTDATTLTIRQAGTTVATIPSLPSGESRTVVFDVETSIAGQFQFTVTGKDADGNERTYESNIIRVQYVAPTPEPTATPAPTSVPPTPSPVPTATPKPTLGEIIVGSVSPAVLYAAAGVLAAVLVALLAAGSVSRARKAKREKNAIDTIELTPDTRNHRGLRRRARKEKAEKPKRTNEDQEPIVPTPELTEDELREKPAEADAARPAEAAPKDEGRRRRAAQETAVTAEETLRVVPVDQRPDFVAQGKVDDSQTRIFGKLTKDAPEAGETQTAEVPRTRREKAEREKKAEKKPEDKPDSKPEDKPAEKAEETIRLSREEVDELRRKQAAVEKSGAEGKKRSEIKPMKKKKSFFGKRKDEEDDFMDEAGDGFDDSDDDFIE